MNITTTSTILTTVSAAKPGFLVFFAAHPIFVVIAALVVLALVTGLISMHPEFISSLTGGGDRDQDQGQGSYPDQGY